LTLLCLAVKSHGTEDRQAAQYISPQAETYDYIVFRGAMPLVCRPTCDPPPTIALTFPRPRTHRLKSGDSLQVRTYRS